VAADWSHAEVVVIAPYYLTTKYPVAVELRDWEKQQATRRHWAFIDATAEGWATHQDNNLLSADRIHPSEAGQQFIADHLAADLHRDGVVKHATASEPRA
jgi:lysophospholipase L1-like esterase